jgi:shikimate kinase
MFNVCPGCGEQSVDKAVEAVGPSAALAVCGRCNHRHPFRLLPLFIVTGASGTGKTTVGLQLVSALSEFVVLDSDILWSPSLDTPEAKADGYREYRTRWLRLAKNISQGGRAVVLLGSAVPEQFESSPERRYFSEIHYLALVCSPETLDSRLSSRPAWRGSGSAEVRERMRAFNTWLRENAPNTHPSMALLDTSAISIERTVEMTATWVRERQAPRQ